MYLSIVNYFRVLSSLQFMRAMEGGGRKNRNISPPKDASEGKLKISFIIQPYLRDFHLVKHIPVSHLFGWWSSILDVDSKLMTFFYYENARNFS